MQNFIHPNPLLLYLSTTVYCVRFKKSYGQNENQQSTLVLKKVHVMYDKKNSTKKFMKKQSPFIDYFIS